MFGKNKVIETLNSHNIALQNENILLKGKLEAISKQLQAFEDMKKAQKDKDLAEEIKKKGEFRITPYVTSRADAVYYCVEQRVAPGRFIALITGILSKQDAEKYLRALIEGHLNYTSKGVKING